MGNCIKNEEYNEDSKETNSMLNRIVKIHLCMT